MNKLLLLLFLLVSSAFANAQDQAEAPDSLLVQELKMTKYDKDTSASAVILSDIGSVYILPEISALNLKRYFTRNIKIKILSEAGLSNAAFAIPLYYHSNYGENLTRLDATTYNMEDDKVVGTPFYMNQIHEEKNPLLTFERIAMPNVRVGSVISISYTIRSPFISYFNWTFQYDIPVVVTAFNLTASPFLHYECISQSMDSIHWKRYSGWDNTHTTLGHDDVVHTYAYDNLPAFKDEVFMSSKEDYLMEMSFQLTKLDNKGYLKLSFLSSWKDFTDELLLYNPGFGEYIYSKEGYIDGIAKQLQLKGKPEIEKVKVIVDYVKTNYKWNNIYSSLAGKKMKDFIAEKSGSSADINLFLVSLFKSADINANPVILSTRAHGKIKATYPFAAFYNDVICYVKTDSLSLLLDATEPLLPYNALPPQCTNGVGYIVQENDSAWVDLKPKMAAKKLEFLIIKIPQNADSIDCKFTIKASGYSGFLLRKDWSEGYEKFSSSLIKNKGMNVEDSVKVFSFNNPEEPFSITYSGKLSLIKQQADSTNGYRIIFSPFLKEPDQDNPFKTTDRKYPIDMNYPHDFTYQSTVVIPQGYKLYEMPAEVSHSMLNNKAAYTYRVKQISDNVIQFTSDLAFNVAVFRPSDYKELQALYDMAIKKCKEPIILQKI